jgi:hypothetical protein
MIFTIAIISPYSINWVVCLMEPPCTLPLRTVSQFNFKILSSALGRVQHQDWLTARPSAVMWLWLLTDQKIIKFCPQIVCAPCILTVNTYCVPIQRSPIVLSSSSTLCTLWSMKWICKLILIFKVSRVFEYMALVRILVLEGGKYEIGGSCIITNLQFLTLHQTFLGW